MDAITKLRHVGIYAQSTPNKPAVILGETGETLTYKELDEYALKLVHLYRRSGLKNSDHIAYLIENRVECLALQCGAHYAGLYYTFLNTRLTHKELSYIIEDCDAKIIVISRKYANAALIQMIQQLPHAPDIMILGESEFLGVPSLTDLLEKTPIQRPDDLIEGNEMLYSSGTTGKPKGVKPTMTGLPLGTTEIVAIQIEREFGFSAETIYLSTAPYYHAAPLKWCRAVLALGATIVLMEKFEAETALQILEKYKVTHSQWVPTMFHRLLDLPPEIRNQYDYSSLKSVIHAAAPCAIPTKMKMIAWWGPIVYEYYGSTEQIGMTIVSTEEWLNHIGTVGRAIYGNLHVVDDAGKELGPNQIGNVYFSDTAKFTYHKDLHKTLEVYNTLGWACVGDIGYLDQDGYLYLTDRKSNLIISGGVNVYPQETENVLIEHAEVRDVAVFGIPHSDLGESVHAVIELYDEAKASDELIEDLNLFCRAQISSIKCPKTYAFQQDLPREPSGKLIKRLLRDEYLAQLKSEGV